MRVQLTHAIAAATVALSPTQALAAPSFEEIAREFSGGLMWLRADVPPAIADDGTVVFAGSQDYATYEGEVLFAGSGGALTARDAAGYGLSSLNSPQIDDAGNVVFVATRSAGPVSYRGVYRTSVGSPGFSTYYEGELTAEWPSHYVTSNVALSPNGTVAFATIRNGAGAIYRGSVAGSPSTLRGGSGTFFNVRDLDVNDLGQVPVQMEYVDPTAGLSRGILIFEAPEQTLGDIDTAIERLHVGAQPLPAINASGQVAFVLHAAATLLFFDPPGVYSPVPATTITLQPGVYVSTPTPWGEPTEVTQIANLSGPYASFGKVRINDSGLVVFEASLDAGGGGIFTGPNPVAHKVVMQGDVVDGALFSWLKMGELNNAGELSLLTSDWYSTDRQVWRVSNLPRPVRIRLPRPIFPFPPLPRLPRIPELLGR